MAQTNRETIRAGAKVFIVGAAGTALAGALVQLVVQPSTNVPDERWSYPWAWPAPTRVARNGVVLAVLLLAGARSRRLEPLVGD